MTSISHRGSGPVLDMPGQRPYVLAIDTSLGAVSACLLNRRDFTTIDEETLIMERGHAEALLPLLDRLLAKVEGDVRSLDRIGVTVGPGSFTGIRVGVAAARALGLACKRPVVGISTLAALAAPAIASGAKSLIVSTVDARHGSVYAQIFSSDGTTVAEARHASVSDVLKMAAPGPLRLVGSGAPMIAIEAWSQGITADVVKNALFPRIALVARLAMLADPIASPPKPLYLKPPDAKPQASFALLDGTSSP